MTDKIDITLPADQLEGTEATLSQWLVSVGDAVVEGQPMVELETDKVSIEVAAPADGTVTEFVLNSGDKVEPDALLGYMSAAADQVAATAEAATPSSPSAQAAAATAAVTPAVPVSPGNGNCRHLKGPAVRRLVAEHNLDFDRIPGTGRGGRVTRSDVIGYINSGQAQADKTVAAARPAPASTATAAGGAIPSRMVPHTTMDGIQQQQFL